MNLEALQVMAIIVITGGFPIALIGYMILPRFDEEEKEKPENCAECTKIHDAVS